MTDLLQLLRRGVAGIVAALLPAAGRSRLAQRYDLDVAPFSLGLGLLQGAVGLYLFAAGGLSYMRTGGISAAMLLLENWQPGLSNTDLGGAYLVNWIAWFVHPLAWLFAALALSGLARCVAFAATREPIGEPLVLLAWWLFRRVRRGATALERRRMFGPARPDRLLRDPTGVVTVLARDPKPDWNEQVTIDVGGQLYRVTDVDERADGPWRVLAYRLSPQPDNDIVRRLVRYPGS